MVITVSLEEVGPPAVVVAMDVNVPDSGQKLFIRVGYESFNLLNQKLVISSILKTYSMDMMELLMSRSTIYLVFTREILHTHLCCVSGREFG